MAYQVPDPVRNEIERLLNSGVTSTPAITGRLHRHEFAVSIDHRIGVVEQVKSEYQAANPDELYTITDEPLSDERLDAALDASS